MPPLYAAKQFSQGLNAQFARVNTPEGAYPLLFNGRNQRGTIAPVRKHSLVTNLPAGNFQAISALGDYILVMISGLPYYRNLVTDSAWSTIPGFSAMSATADEIYVSLQPIGSSRFNFVNGANVLNAAIGATAQCLLLQDNINQPRLIFFNGATMIAQAYEAWSMSNPSYVPQGTFNVVSGVRGYMASSNRALIYATRSGRPLDYVLALTASGDKAAAADKYAIAVDFNPLTALLPSSDGGVIATTLNATYQVYEDTNDVIFGEYRLKSKLLFPVGCVNYKSFCDLMGDSAFISPAGIQSFNVTAQTQRESNNFPLGARIAKYLVNPQSGTAAINYDTFALFAVNTQFGEVVAVFDTTLQQFVSFDTGFGKVKQFAVHRSESRVRLWFINTDNELYEAYAADEYAQVGLLVGDYSATAPTLDHVISEVQAAFVNIQSAVDVRVTLYADQVEIAAGNFSLGSDSILLPPAPTVTPFPDSNTSGNILLNVQTRRIATASSLWFQWSGYAELASVTMEGENCKPQSGLGIRPQTRQGVYAFFGHFFLDEEEQTGTAADFSGLTPGEWYFMDGACNTGASTITDSSFQAIGTTVFDATGRLSLVSDNRDLKNSVAALRPNAVYTIGDVTSPAGTSDDYNRFYNFFRPWTDTPGGLAGDIELATDSGEAWYSRNQRYYQVFGEYVSFFFFNADDIDGITATSTQVQDLLEKLALSTARFNVLVTNKPLWSDTAVGDNTGIQYLLAYFSAVISGGSGRYERFYVNGKTLVNAACASESIEALNRGQTSVYTTTATGFLAVTADAMQLRFSFRALDGSIQDEVSIAS